MNYPTNHTEGCVITNTLDEHAEVAIYETTNADGTTTPILLIHQLQFRIILLRTLQDLKSAYTT